MPYNLDIPGFMTEGDLQVIESLAQKVPHNGTIIEIGSFMGRSSWAFAQSSHPSVTVYCIDRWESFELDSNRQEVMSNYNEKMVYDFDAFKGFVKDCPNIVPIKSPSLEVMWPQNKKADLIFIDASHKSPDVDEDLAYWLPHLKKSGIFCGHDFNTFSFPDVCKAVINLSEKIDLPIVFFKNSTIWAIDQERNFSSDIPAIVSTPFILEKIKELIEKDQV